MAAWGWVLVGLGALIIVPTLVAVAVARILGRIANDVTELLEHEEWSSAPLTRTLDAADEPDEIAAAADDSSRQRFR
jgi:hypothetical protein